LLPLAESAGFVPRAGYAGKCHLCWDIRRWLALEKGLYTNELGPIELYQAAEQGGVSAKARRPGDVRTTSIMNSGEGAAPQDAGRGPAGRAFSLDDPLPDQ
jgi:hypothetical protein